MDVDLLMHLIDNPAGDTHAIEDGHIDDGRHSSIVDGLRAVRPHVGTLSQVNVAGRKTARGQEQDRILNNSALALHVFFLNKHA